MVVASDQQEGLVRQLNVQYPETKMTNFSRKPRWWLLALIILAATLALTWIWLVGDQIRQERVVNSLAVTVVAATASLAWLLILSGFTLKTRILALAGIIGVGLLAALLFRIEGVDGDLTPIIGFRWSSQPVHQVAAHPSRSPILGSESLESSPPSDENLKQADSEYPLSPPVETSKVVEDAQEIIEAPFEVFHFPGFLGPNRDGKIEGINLKADWENESPRLIWSRPVGAGWSSFAVAGRLAVTQEQRGPREAIVAYDLLDGTEKWAHDYPARYETTVAGVGPRATPTIATGRVLAMGATGILTCLEFETGSRLWQRDVREDAGSANPPWGTSCSPLVVERKVIVSGGGQNNASLLAYDIETGAPIWQAGSSASGYSSPQLRELAGKLQIIILNHDSVTAHDPETGEVLWSVPWPKEQPNVSQPLPIGPDKLLVSSGYGVGSRLFQIEPTENGFEAKEMWRTPRMKAKFTNLIFHRGYVYGLDDGILACLDPTNGQLMWKRGRYGHGQILLVGDRLLIMAEDGELVLVDPNPQSLRELSRFQALDSKTWNPPALAGNLLLVRNDRKAACYELPLRVYR